MQDLLPSGNIFHQLDALQKSGHRKLTLKQELYLCTAEYALYCVYSIQFNSIQLFYYQISHIHRMLCYIIYTMYMSCKDRTNIVIDVEK